MFFSSPLSFSSSLLFLSSPSCSFSSSSYLCKTIKHHNLTGESHNPDGDPVVPSLHRRVVVAESEPRHDGREEVQQEADHAEGGAGHDVRWKDEDGVSYTGRRMCKMMGC